MSSPRAITLSPKLVSAILSCWDELQNLRLLVKGADFALQYIDDLEDREPIVEILRAADRSFQTIHNTMLEANELDVAAVIEDRPARALANRVVQYLADSGGKPETPESLLAQGMECDAELLRMALGVLGQ